MAVQKKVEIGNTGIFPDYHVLFHFAANDLNKQLTVETIAWIDQAARDAGKEPTSLRVKKDVSGEQYDALINSPIPEGCKTIRDVCKVAGYLAMQAGTDLEDGTPLV